jgi:putative RecB family exonuclease
VPTIPDSIDVQLGLYHLALQLRSDRQWQPKTGKHCDRCSYQAYCAEKTCEPELLLGGKRIFKLVQLTLEIKGR